MGAWGWRLPGMSATSMVYSSPHTVVPPLSPGKASPIRWQPSSGSMMLDWLGRRHNDDAAIKAADCIEQAVTKVLEIDKIMTSDIGGEATTAQVGDAVAERIPENNQT